MPHVASDTVIRTGDTIDKIEEDLCEVAAIWFERSKADVQKEMNRLGLREKIKEEYKVMLVRLTERMH